MNHFIRNLALYLVPMILSLTVHEFAHAFVATKLGDDTPEREDRLTLSPLAHIDPIGTLALPALAIFTLGYALVGWARPVNINPAHFHRRVSMRAGLAIASAAGPLSNLLLAVIAMGTLVGLLKAGQLPSTEGPSGAIRSLLVAFFRVNVGLCVFNFLPIPPLDGSRLLPRTFDGFVEQAQRYSVVLFLIVFWVPAVRAVLLDLPIHYLESGILSLFGQAS